MGKSTQILTIRKYQKKNSKFICLSVILIDAVLRAGKSYYLWVFLEECKYVVKEKNAWAYYWWHRNFFWFW